MSSVEACRECGRLYPFLARGVCAECLQQRDDQFHKVKEWLRENHAHTPAQVAEATEVPAALITEWVMQGRLEFAQAVDGEALEEQKRQAELRDRLKGDLIRSVSDQPAPPAEQYRGMHSRDGRRA